MKKLMLTLMMAAMATFAFGSLAIAQDAPTSEPPAPVETTGPNGEPLPIGPDGEPMPLPIPEGLH